jgi:hypothetical protein
MWEAERMIVKNAFYIALLPSHPKDCVGPRPPPHYAVGPSLERLQCKAPPVLTMPNLKHVWYSNQYFIIDPVRSLCHALILNPSD